MSLKTAELDKTEEITPTYPPGFKKLVRLTKVRDARRLLSRLITEFQQGTVESRWAKDLCYLVISYVQVAKDTEFEERLKQLEEKVS